MKRDTRELIGFPSALLVGLLCAYGLLKLIKSLPAPTSDEAMLLGQLILVFVGAPFFFGCIAAMVIICAWMASGDNK